MLNVEMIEWEEVHDLGATERDVFGFGSTGS
jgi:dUTPase